MYVCSDAFALSATCLVRLVDKIGVNTVDHLRGRQDGLPAFLLFCGYTT
jgi:hypothetical protein